jgi:hypothetical protein
MVSVPTVNWRPWLRSLKDDIWRWPPVDRCARRSEDKVVQFVVWLLGWLQAFWNAPAYSWLSRRAARRWSDGEPWLYFNHLYVGVWVLLLLPGLAVASSCTSGWSQFAIVGVALWRAAEIMTWYVKLLFDKGHRVLIEVERNLLFLIADSVAFVTVLALMIETADDGDLLGKWPDALSAFTLNGPPNNYDGGWVTAVGVVGAGGGVVLLGAGLALLTGIIGERIDRAMGPTYTGPTRPPAPWH